MRFLHTSDWHFGKTLYDVSLIEDQNFFLKQLYEELEKAENEKKPYDALIIPGDIYDRAIPSVEGVELFNSFLIKMNENFPEVHIFIISGNHDGAKRLGFASELLHKTNIHIQTDANKITPPIILKGVAIYQIPFLTPSAFFEDDSLRTQNELYEKATAKIKEYHEKNHKEMPSIISAHATVYGCDDPENEMLVGTAASIDKEYFKDFTYTALGHIHKYQKLDSDGKIYYSGSPIPYSFDDNSKTVEITEKDTEIVSDKKEASVESKKYMLDVEIDENKKEMPISVKKIKLNILHPIFRLKGKWHSLFNNLNYETYKKCYIEITCTDNPQSKEPKQVLNSKYDTILSFVLKKFETIEDDSNFEDKLRNIKNDSKDSYIELFEQFLKYIHPEQDNQAEIDLFKEEFSKLDKEV